MDRQGFVRHNRREGDFEVDNVNYNATGQPTMPGGDEFWTFYHEDGSLGSIYPSDLYN
jgi:hypothetical protein